MASIRHYKPTKTVTNCNSQILLSYIIAYYAILTVANHACFKDTIPIFRAEFGNFGKWPRDGNNAINDIFAYRSYP